ncbi:MAG: hypothetical protein EZS28_014375 [Streblomastix strix]|uniref:Uncharacterized protein n=1 Tax=Streblomastix strix TaxID=222440 RepID=A0A5J4W6K6_9EUKA|nr:MAG: hypothetical protein EZS28_014375 [Streblomastix strix]
MRLNRKVTQLKCIMLHDNGLVTLTNIFIQRSNEYRSENIPIVMIIRQIGQLNNEIKKNSTGQLVISNCILEGGNSANSKVWFDQGLDKTCDVGYDAAIVADGQSDVQISGSTIRTFE